MAHKPIFEGVEGRPDNYLLVLADESSEYVSPRHRHPWDQIRYCLSGSIPIGRNATVDAGEIAYFPESVAYGPQQGGGDRLVLLLQFGGSSGQGYLSVEQTDRGRTELEALGAFEGGTFRRHDPGPGERANQDAYEAIWEHVTGEALIYAEPAYRAPVVLRPEAFPWRPAGIPGVVRRRLGSFAPREVALGQFRIAAGARWRFATADHERVLAFVHDGTGVCNGHGFAGHAALRLEPGDTVDLTATTEAEVFTMSVELLAEDTHTR
jgi:quercetin dioxygenase-like cupin family protein